MQIQECYLYITDKLNELSSNNSQNIPHHVFIRTMREATYLWLDERLKVKDKDETRLRELQPLSVNKLNIVGNKKDKFYEFILPNDYYHPNTVITKAKKDNCQLDLVTDLVEISNADSYYQNDELRPDFKWEQTFYTLNNKLNVYYREFDITNINFYYFRKPIDVDIEGYINIDNIDSTNIDSDFTGSSLFEILNITTELLALYTNNNRFQGINNIINTYN